MPTAGLLVVALSCAAPRNEVPEAVSSQQPPSPERPFVTVDRDVYRIERTADALQLTIVSTFTNHAAATVYLHPCGTSQPSFALEKWISGEWRPAYGQICPAMLMLDPPRVAPGESRTDTARVQAMLGPNAAPRFDVQPVEGTYRLVYAQAYGSWRANEGPGELLPLNQRVSPAFRIVE